MRSYIVHKVQAALEVRQFVAGSDGNNKVGCRSDHLFHLSKKHRYIWITAGLEAKSDDKIPLLHLVVRYARSQCRKSFMDIEVQGQGSAVCFAVELAVHVVEDGIIIDHDNVFRFRSAAAEDERRIFRACCR